MERNLSDAVVGVETRITEPITAAEIAEYRRIRPQLLRMLDEWQRIRVGCPIAHQITTSDE